MVDWSKQFQESIRNWTAVQERASESWAKAARSFSGRDAGSQWAQEALKILDAWEESVRATVDFPVEQARVWAESVSQTDAAPAQVREMAERLHSTARILAGVQKQLIETWFASLRNLAPSERETGWEKVLNTWRDTSQKALEAQAEWMRLWMTGPAESTRGGPGKRSPSSSDKS